MSILQQKRNECANLVRTSNRVLNKVRCSNSESKEHRILKEAVCDKLEQDKKHYITEAIFRKADLIADILVLDDFKIIEIAVSESEESLKIKEQKARELGLKIQVVRA